MPPLRFSFAAAMFLPDNADAKNPLFAFGQAPGCAAFIADDAKRTGSAIVNTIFLFIEELLLN
jgi:hypothetical protein